MRECAECERKAKSLLQACPKYFFFFLTCHSEKPRGGVAFTTIPLGDFNGRLYVKVPRVPY